MGRTELKESLSLAGGSPCPKKNPCPLSRGRLGIQLRLYIFRSLSQRQQSSNLNYPVYVIFFRLPREERRLVHSIARRRHHLQRALLELSLLATLRLAKRKASRARGGGRRRGGGGYRRRGGLAPGLAAKAAADGVDAAERRLGCGHRSGASAPNARGGHGTARGLALPSASSQPSVNG